MSQIKPSLTAKSALSESNASSTPTHSDAESETFLWYRDKLTLKIGDVNRYNVRYKRQTEDENEIYLRIKNIEKTSIRAIHMLSGPFILYCHVIPHNYTKQNKFSPEGDESEVEFANQIKPGRTFNVKLKLNENSHVEGDEYAWEIDVISQIYISRHTQVVYDMMIGSDFQQMKKLNHGLINFKQTEAVVGHNPNLTVMKRDTDDLWTVGPPNRAEPAHLIILTHGLFSNLTADMLYLKDLLEQSSNDNILVRGYRGNAGRTEKGVKRLGTGMGQYLMELISELNRDGVKVDRISFIGHSLGGLIQLAAIKYVLMKGGSRYFEERGIQPVHLVAMASPLLGILNEMSFWILWFLDLGTLGKTGRDLTLSKRLPSVRDIKRNHHHNHHEKDEAAVKSSLKPILVTLPDDPLQTFLGSFKHLTVYANAINDGIVPLRTASLLYLDWGALGSVEEKKRENEKEEKEEKNGELQGGEVNQKQGEQENGQTHHGYSEVVPEGEAKEKKNREEGKDARGRVDREGSPVSSGANSSVVSSQSGSESMLSLYSDDSIGEVPDSNPPTQSVVSKYKTLLTLNFNVPNKYSFTRGKLSKKERALLKINARGLDLKDELGLDLQDDEDSTEFVLPPKASAVESAFNTYLCPVPSRPYILDPESRPEVIFHDKYYHYGDLPPYDPEETTTRTRLKLFFFNYYDWRVNKQVCIARKYHTEKLVWRKVLVSLPPDAHNNIVVRRRFANGYGWGVVDHVCSQFNDRAAKM